MKIHATGKMLNSFEARVNYLTLSAEDDDEREILAQQYQAAKDGLLGCIGRREQDAIRDKVIELSGYQDVDGAGCDSGDPLDFTLDEIAQGFTYIENRLYDAIRAARPGFEWPEGKSAVDVAIELIGGRNEAGRREEAVGQVARTQAVRDVQGVGTEG